MLARPRVIPALLLRGAGLVKTVRFRRPTYLGDPINIAKIFNEKEVDELVVLDIGATPEGRAPRFDLLHELAVECFMPLGYGGGVRDLETVRRIFELGVEKVVLNTCAVEAPAVIRQAADAFGSQSIAVSVDAKKRLLGGYEVVIRGGRVGTGRDPVSFAREVVDRGAGEILLTAVHRDGTMAGYDLDLVRAVATAVDIPVIACGGARTIRDFAAAVRAGASAVAAGSMFVFQGPHRAVLINYPTEQELDATFATAGHLGAR